MTVELKEVEYVSAAEAARKALAEIKNQNAEGLLTAEDVVNTASDESHALHRYFTWDDSEAGHQWRLMQARSLIRKVVVTVENNNESPVRKYVSLKADRNRKGGGFREMQEVVNSADLLDELESTLKKDLEAVLGRYSMLEKLCQKIRKAAGINTRKRPQKG